MQLASLKAKPNKEVSSVCEERETASRQCHLSSWVQLAVTRVSTFPSVWADLGWTHIWNKASPRPRLNRCYRERYNEPLLDLDSLWLTQRTIRRVVQRCPLPRTLSHTPKTTGASWMKNKLWAPPLLRCKSRWQLRCSILCMLILRRVEPRPHSSPGTQEARRGDRKVSGRWPHACFWEIFPPLVFLENHTFFCQDSEKLWFEPLAWSIHARCRGHRMELSPPKSWVIHLL